MSLRGSILVVPVIAALAFAWAACGRDSGPREPDVMLQDSFEKDGDPTLGTWYPDRYDSVSVVPGDCPDGGDWALRLTGIREGGSRSPWISRSFDGFEDGDIVELSVWMRSESPYGLGRIGICYGYSDVLACFLTNDGRALSTEWTRISVIRTIHRDEQSWFRIYLSATAYADTASVLFDRFEMVRLGNPSRLKTPMEPGP